VWRQAIVFGLVKVSKHIEHVTCFLRFFKKDSIVNFHQVVENNYLLFAILPRERELHASEAKKRITVVIWVKQDYVANKDIVKKRLSNFN